ncbi:hypothetical protein ISS09_00475 [Candidatus Woesearchaeota archaeon]|nr:hypothetical protein [Candidatus Woesearchaeota archaeon]
MEELIVDIMSKKELQNLDKKIIEKELKNFLEKNHNLKKKLETKDYNKRSEEYKIVLKEIRRQLRDIYGVFIQKNYSKREKLLEKNSIEEILKLHKSTKERLPYYKEVYSKIFEITGKEQTILDLACGLNPISYGFLGYKPKYIASEISEKDLEFIQEFFNKKNINGKTIAIDLVTEQNKLGNIEADICFLFKALDSLETRKRHISKALIETLNCKWIVVSFSKISLGGSKKIEKSKRNWLITFINKKSFSYKEFEVKNEFFVVIKTK